MGILNVTPDSFSDGGLYADSSAVDAGLRMIDEGADLIDVGGESTRPGSDPVSLADELARILPVVEGLSSRGVSVSIDTMKAEVARQALLAGARVVNDVSALGDPMMAEVCAGASCSVCLMHMKGSPKTMQADPNYGEVVAEVKSFLAERVVFAESTGISRDRIWLDPGIGFGKIADQNLALLRGLPALVEMGFPTLVGVSRKSFLGRFTANGELAPVDRRLGATISAQVLAQTNGARIIRAHDVWEARQAIEFTSSFASVHPSQKG